MSATICVGTEYECDCDCKCPAYCGDPNHECDWPDCGCACLPECIGCGKAREDAASVPK